MGDLQNQCQQQEEKHQALTIELEQLRAAAKAAKNSPRNKSNNTSLPHSKSGTWVSVGNVNKRKVFVHKTNIITVLDMLHHTLNLKMSL